MIIERYKDTKFGCVPKNWNVVQLKDVTNLIKDGSHNPPKRISNGIPMISAENIFDGKINFGMSEKNISIEDYKKMHITYEPEVGDILMTTVGTIGRTAVINESEKFTFQRSVAIFKVKPELDSKYLEYSLNANYLKKQISVRSNTTAQAGIYLGELSKLNVILPPLDEQVKIVKILSTLDEQVNLTNQLIEKTKKLKNGLMQQLFNTGIGHKKFKDSKFGKIPENWKILSMDEVGNSVDYRGKTPKKSKEGVKLITARNIKKGFIDYETSSEYIPSDEYLTVMSRGKAEKGDILFTTEAPLGNVAILDQNDIALAQRVIKYRVYSFMDNRFFMYYLLSLKFKKVLERNATGSTVLGIKGKTLKKLPVVVPDLDEQKKIAVILSTVDQEIEAYQMEKEKYTELKKGLMQQLLTGRTRVIV